MEHLIDLTLSYTVYYSVLQLVWYCIYEVTSGQTSVRE